MPLRAALHAVKELKGGPGEAVAAVGVNGLRKPESEPGKEENVVGVEEEGPADEGDKVAENGLHRVGVLGRDANGDLKLVVLLVNVLVNGAVVEEPVKPVEQAVLHHHEEGDLPEEDVNRGDLGTKREQPVRLHQVRIDEVVKQEGVDQEVIKGQIQERLQGGERKR